jgi:hypothetical protein
MTSVGNGRVAGCEASLISTPCSLVLARCPEPGCGAPAEVRSAGVLSSTSGPVPHVRTYCAARHWFVLPSAQVPGLAEGGRPVPDETEAARPAAPRGGRDDH